jgi:hypothetical protein
MVHSIVRRSLAAAGFLALAGCAQDNGSHPAYLGLSDLTGIGLGAGPAAAEGDETSEALRHVQSNKVLGAMAFQKVTGQTIDPDSLIGRGE